MAHVRLVWPVDTVSVDHARAAGRQVTMPDFISVFRKLDAFEFGLAVLIEQAQFHFRGMGGEKREVDAETIPGRAKWERLALGDV